MTSAHALALAPDAYRGVFLAKIGGMSSSAGKIEPFESRVASALSIERAHGLLEQVRPLQILRVPSDERYRSRRFRMFLETSLRNSEESYHRATLTLQFAGRSLHLERWPGRDTWWVKNDGPLYPIIGNALDRTSQDLHSALDESAFKVLQRQAEAAWRSKHCED